MKKILLSLFVMANLSACGLVADRTLPDYKITAEGPTRDTKIYLKDNYVGSGKAVVMIPSAMEYKEIKFYVPGCQVGTLDIKWKEDTLGALFWTWGSYTGKGSYVLDKTYYKYDKPCVR